MGNLRMFTKFVVSSRRPEDPKQHKIPFCTVEFSRNYTKLAVLSFLYCFVVKGKLISAKCFAPVGIEPAAPTP